MITLRFAHYAQVIRFTLVGGSAALVNVAALYLFTSLFGIWYIASEVAAFLVALCYNFALQKLWTFKNPHSAATRRQGLWFILINIGNLVVNTAILYVLVEFLGLWYIGAQLIASIIVACESYFLYRVLFR
jgi:putative flippase GtrA